MRAAGHFISTRRRASASPGRRPGPVRVDLNACVDAPVRCRLQEQRSGQVDAGREDNGAGRLRRCGSVNGFLDGRRIDRLPVSFGSVSAGSKVAAWAAHIARNAHKATILIIFLRLRCSLSQRPGRRGSGHCDPSAPALALTMTTHWPWNAWRSDAWKVRGWRCPAVHGGDDTRTGRPERD